MSDNTPLDLLGVYTPLWGATGTTFHSFEKVSTQMPEIIFDNTAENSLFYLEERSQTSKKFVKFINFSPIKESKIFGDQYFIKDFLRTLLFNYEYEDAYFVPGLYR